MDKVQNDALRSTYKSKAEAEKAGMAMGLEGTHKKDGKKVKTRYQAARDEMYKKRLKDMGSYRKYSEKKADHPPSAHKKKKPYADGIASDPNTVGRELDGLL